MASLEPVPAARRLETDRPDLFAVEVVGHISANDVENFYGLLEGAYALHTPLDLLVRIVDHDGIDWNDVDRRTIEAARDHASRSLARCAIVGDGDAAGAFLRIIRPDEARTRRFATDEEAEAWRWLEAAEVGA